MNQTIRELYERKSVRVFTHREIAEEDRKRILESATMAPTAGNQQLYTIIHVTDQKKKELLAESCDHQPFIAEAKMVLEKEILGLPDHIFPAVMLVFGYPTRQQLERKKPERVPLSAIVYENSYPAMEEEEIRAIFSEKTGDDFDGYMQRFCKRKYNSDFSREMQRSVRTFLENSFGGKI